MPFFSVIIPLYNKEDYISDCLKSALNQNFNDYEIIIVNDGSTDKSVAIVESFQSDKIKLFHQKNSGASIARNNATKFSSGRYMAFLDADDIWKPNHLQCLLDSIKEFPNSGIYANNYLIKYSQSLIKPARLNFELRGSTPLKLVDFFKASLLDTVVWTSACSIEKSKFIKYGMFNPIENSLGKIEDNDARFTVLTSFKKEEKENPSLKAYLDSKRYGLALRTKINGEEKIYRETLKLIKYGNLRSKQKILLKTPTILLKLMNKVRPILIKNRLYQAIFKS